MSLFFLVGFNIEIPFEKLSDVSCFFSWRGGLTEMEKKESWWDEICLRRLRPKLVLARRKIKQPVRGPTATAKLINSFFFFSLNDSMITVLVRRYLNFQSLVHIRAFFHFLFRKIHGTFWLRGNFCGTTLFLCAFTS